MAEGRPDAVIGGRYRLISELGSGGFGRVWRARDETLGVAVAVKELRLPPSSSEAERAGRLKRAEREARHAARLRDHPHIVAVHDVVAEDGVPWIVMRLVEGQSLADRIAAGSLSPAQAAPVAAALIEALAAAHDADIAHRDVKPANVLLTERGEVLLTDFGIAAHDADTQLTSTGMFVGSVEYTAPERLEDRGNGAVSDLFSLGATLYHAVEGVSPFARDTAKATMAAILFHQPPPPRRAGPLAELITRLLEKDPARRPSFAEARELAAEAVSPRRETRAETVQQPVDPAPGPPGQPTNRPRIIAGTVASAFGVAMAVLVTMITLSGATHADTRADAVFPPALIAGGIAFLVGVGPRTWPIRHSWPIAIGAGAVTFAVLLALWLPNIAVG
ncbi:MULTISPECIES: serine/threonine-protein kinase [Amycolatopsis]|uniref:serine/threonine-protein kinase n=1 Tax=Amycolatopsis TaxID=1813 RepID=UPI000691F7C6|nr:MULTISPECIES: serine/threonine-protein kinase [Amycolatopsis]